MTKREINTIIRQHSNGISKELCRSIIIQLCCPDIKSKEATDLVNALNYFESETQTLKKD